MQSKHNGAHKWPRVEDGLQWGTWMRMCAGGWPKCCVVVVVVSFLIKPTSANK